MAAKTKIVIGGIVIVAALAWLGFVGFQESKSYYITVDEFSARKNDLAGKTLKLAGDVAAGSIDRSKPQMEFALAGSSTSLRVRYIGSAIIPDTFKDGSKELVVVEGKIGDDGVFDARRIEAKCASKYEAEYETRTTP